MAARSRRVRRRRGCAPRPRRADEPVDAVGRRADARRVGGRVRDPRRARGAAALRLGDGAAAVRRPPARPPAALRGDGRPHGDRRLAEQGAPDDRLARRVGGRPGRPARVGRLGARLQHHDADRHRARRRHGGAARRPGPRRRRHRRARAQARHDHGRARRLAAGAPGRRLVAAGRRGRARHHPRGAVEGAAGARRDRGDADDRLGRRRRRPAPAAGVQRRAGRAAGDDPRADRRDAARGVRELPRSVGA